MTTENFAQKLAKDAVDGLLKQVGKQAQQGVLDGEVTLEPETQKKLIENELKMAADPQFALAQEAALSAADRMRRSRERPPDIRLGEGKKSSEEEIKTNNEKAVALYSSLVNAGMDPKRASEIVSESLTKNQPSLTSPAPTSVTDMIHALKELDELRSQNRTDTPIEQAIKDLKEEIRTLKNAPRVDPPQTPASQISSLTDLVDGLVKLGVVDRRGTVVASEGESMDVVKERNRHEEEMFTRSSEAKYKGDIADTLAKIPENIGKGIAGQIAENKEPTRSASSASSEIKYLLCTKEGCGYNIPYPPEAIQVICPKCGTVYARTKEKE